MYNDPYRVQILPSALVGISHSSDAPSFRADTLPELLSRELAGTHFILNDDNDRVYGLKNTEFLLSGFSLGLRYNLTSTAAMYAI